MGPLPESILHYRHIESLAEDRGAKRAALEDDTHPIFLGMTMHVRC
jgi:hypothetical protein